MRIFPSPLEDNDTENSVVHHSRCKKYVPMKRPPGSESAKWKHSKSRQSHRLLPRRMHVPEDQVSWDISWPNYEAKVPSSVSFGATSPSRSTMESSKLELNGGRWYVKDSNGNVLLQKNPYGRTGLTGKGVLSFDGPNEAYDPVITRLDPSSGKTQVLVCRFEGRKDWDEECLSLPGGRTGHHGVHYDGLPIDKKLPQYLDYVIDSNSSMLGWSKDTAEKIKPILESLFKNCGKQVFPDNVRYNIGYCDDPRNTDDAWIETKVFHFHIGDGLRDKTPILDIDSRNEYWPPLEHSSAAGSGESFRMKFRWLDVDNGSTAYKSLYASHKFFVDLCIPLCACGRRRFDKSDTSHRCLKYTPGPLEEARLRLRESCRAQASVAPADEAPAFSRNVSESFSVHAAETQAFKSDIDKWTHKKARQSGAYPQSRFPVDDARVAWTVPWSEYDKRVLPGSAFDTAPPASSRGDRPPDPAAYRQGNPFGRTGLRGRGNFHFWGPNDARDPVITRVNRGSRRAEVLMCRMAQHDVEALNSVLRLPGAMADGDGDTHAQRRRVPEFLGGVLRHNHARSPVCGLEEAERRLGALFAPGGGARKVYPDGLLYPHGYVDDPRNTDDAWVATRVYHFHVPPAVGDLLDIGPALPQDLREWRPAGDRGPVLMFEWRGVEEAIGDTAFASHGFFIDLCVPLCRCGLRKYDAASGCHEVPADEPPPGAPAGEAGEPGDGVAPGRPELERVPALGAARGRMQFGEKPLVSRYVRARVDGGDDAAAVCRSLFEGPKPEIGYWLSGDSGDDARPFWRPVSVISVTGGAQDFQLARGDARKEREVTEQIFPLGILKAAHEMRALIIDGGTAAGVMREVGRAVYRDGDRVATLGICPWGTALDLQELQRQRGARERGQYTYTLTSEHPNSDWCAQLDPNHRYFALVDDGSYGREAFGKEIPGRQLIERALTQGETYVAPHVAVVVNGGVGTIRTLRYSGISEGQRAAPPIVVVQGTGRAADLLAAVWHHLHCGDDESGARKCFASSLAAACVDIVPVSNGDDNVGCRVIKQLFKKYLPRESKTTDRARVLADVVEICRRKEAITVHRIDGVDSLSYSLMKSVCVGTLRKLDSALKSEQLLPLPLREQLEYAMAWDGEDAVRIAREMITDEIAASSTFSVSQLKSLLSTAILRDRTGFVEVLINSGVRLEFQDVMALYEVQDSKIKNPLHQHVSRILLQNFPSKQWNAEACVRQDEQSPEHQFRDASSVIVGKTLAVSVDKAMSVVMGWSRCSDFHCMFQESLKLERGAEEIFSTSEEVFLWCILNGRADMAELFLRKCHPISRQHSISRALFAASISRRVGVRYQHQFRAEAQRLFIGKSEDGSAETKGISSRFENIALELLDLCYRQNPESALDALTLPLLQPWLQSAVWVDAGSFLLPPRPLDPIMLTQIAGATEFAAHEAFQTALDRVWYGRLVRSGTASPSKGAVLRLPNFLSFFDGKVIQVLNSVIFPGVDFIEMAYIIGSWVCFPCLIFLQSPDDDHSKKSGITVFRQSCFSSKEWELRFSVFYTAPITKFWSSFASYFLFLSLYTVVGLEMGFEETPLELVVNCWILTFALAVLRRLLVDGWKTWLNKTNNLLDMVTLAFYIPAFALRRLELGQFCTSAHRWSLNATSFGSPVDLQNSSFDNALNGTLKPLSTTFWALNGTLEPGQPASYQELGQDMMTARSWHGAVGILFWMRCVDFLSVSYVLGPLRLVLFRVLVDAFQFFILLLIFIVAFGTAMICAARPVRDPNIPLLQGLKLAVYLPYMQIFGEHFLDNSLFSANPGDNEDRSHRQLGSILYCAYLFIASIVLMNLLIATPLFPPTTFTSSLEACTEHATCCRAEMNSTYAEEFAGIKKKWLFHRLELVAEYATAPILPAPAAAILDIYALLNRLLAALGVQRCSAANQPIAAAAKRAWVKFEALKCRKGSCFRAAEAGDWAGGIGTRWQEGIAAAEEFFLSDEWLAILWPSDYCMGSSDEAAAAARTRRCTRAVSEAFVSWMAAGAHASH